MNQRIIWLLCSLIFTQMAHAHGLHLFALSDGEQLLGRAYFSDGSPAVSEQVSVYVTPEKLIGTTTTDANGRFTFPITAKSDYTLIIEGMEGHRADYRIAASELATFAAKTEHSANSPTIEQLQPLITKTIRQELQPLREQLDQYEHKTRWHDILGGIGYIVGIMGLLLFFKKRE